MERQNQKQQKERKEDGRGEEGKVRRAGLRGFVGREGQRMARNWICQAQPDEVNLISISNIHRPPLSTGALFNFQMGHRS